MKIPINIFYPWEKLSFHIVLFTFCIAIFTPSLCDAHSKKKILLLNSYSYDMKWTRSISESISNFFNAQDHMEVVVEFMDTKRHPTPEQLQALYNSYERKYTKTIFDLIITSDDNASKFALTHRAALFPETPIVFCGVNDTDFPYQENFNNITGVLEAPAFNNTLNIAIQLLPASKQVFVINESRTTGQADRKALEQVFNSFSGELSFTWWEDKSEKEITNLLTDIPENSIVLLLSFFGEKENRVFTVNKGAQFISQTSKAPVFSMWEYFLEEGIVGGQLTSGKYQGLTAAEIGLNILNGAKPSSIPVISTSANRYMFDAEQLDRFNIHHKQLPLDAIIINVQPSFIKEYKAQVMSIAAAMLTMLIFIFVLLASNRAKRLAEKDMKKSQERLTLAQRIGHIGSWEYDLETETFWLSDEMYNLFSIEKGKKITLNTFQPLIHPKDLGLLIDFFRQSLDYSPQEYEREFRIITQEGLTKDIHITGSSHTNSISNNRKITGVAFDFTTRKETELALLNERERLAVTLRSIGDGVITTDIDGRIVFLNKVAEELTGWTNKEALGIPSPQVFNIINEKTGETCASPVQKVLELGRIIGLANHTAIIAKDGSLRSIADSGAPIRDKKSNIIGVIIVFRDVTKEKRLEEELLKARKLESVGVLAGGIAHDFNNILSAILGNIELAAKQLPKEEQKIATLLGNAQKATVRASKLTYQLLTFSKGGDPIKETTSLPKLVEDSANFVLHGSHLTCDFSFADNLWMVEADTGQFSQVIQNIVINARHAMPEGGHIKVACSNVVDPTSEAFLSMHEGSFVCITIQDFGIGIPVEIIDKIFDPYFTTKQQGSGLGLAICHSIISKHDGHVLVDSNPGKGTTFTIYLPAANGPESKTPTLERPNKLGRSAFIMVMDDEEMLRSLAHTQLTNLGHKVVLVEEGLQALNLYRELQDRRTPVDLVIMDLTIRGGMGGEEASKKLLEINPDAKIIIASGYSNDPIIANYKDHGLCAAVIKPFDLTQLATAIDKALSS